MDRLSTPLNALLEKLAPDDDQELTLPESIAILTDYSTRCASDDVAVAIMVVLAELERLRTALDNIQRFGAKAQSEIARDALASEFEVMMVRDYGVQFVDVTPKQEGDNG